MSTDGTVRSASDADVNRLLAELLGVQARLATPVTRAAAAYDAHSAKSALRTPHSEVPTSAQSEIGNQKSKIHQDLIPLTAPAPGEQYAFQVDLDACSGCKACVAACHSLNGLDENEAWRDVGLLVAAGDTPWQQTVTTACHHCSEPGCLEGCPVVAYEKDPLTGIVRHLDDQCIGCSYCILKCPYDVPKFNTRLGIVRKCDMCQQRLAVGEAPACVQACPTQAISIVKVPTDASAPTEAAPSACACGGACGCNSAAPPSVRGAASRPAPVERGQSSDPSSVVAGSRSDSASTFRLADRSSRPTAVVRPPPGGSGFTPDIRPPLSASASPVSGLSALRSPVSGSATPSTVHRPPPTAFLPAAPDPSYTKPTTRYVSQRGLPAHVRAADSDTLRIQPAHWPLVAMLTLTQLAVGLLATAPLVPLPASAPTLPNPFTSFPASIIGPGNHWLTSSGSLPLPELVTYYITSPREHADLLIGLALLFAGLGASGLHLGKPLRAWRFFLGLRTSWLSREILVFSGFAPLALALLLWPASLPLRAAVAVTGLLGVACSAMIYIDTHRRSWATRPTGVRFFGTVIVAAAALVSPPLAAALLLAKLAAESVAAFGPGATARMLRGPLCKTMAFRVALGLGAVAAFLASAPWLALALFATGELAERLLFFRSVDAPKMPGHPAP